MVWYDPQGSTALRDADRFFFVIYKMMFLSFDGVRIMCLKVSYLTLVNCVITIVFTQQKSPIIV